jgi:hypothetical protein
VWLIAKNYPPAALLRRAPRIAYVQAADLYLAWRARRLGLWARAMRDALRGLPAALRRRRAVAARRRVGLPALEAVVRADQPARRFSRRRPPST